MHSTTIKDCTSHYRCETPRFESNQRRVSKEILRVHGDSHPLASPLRRYTFDSGIYFRSQLGHSKGSRAGANPANESHFQLLNPPVLSLTPRAPPPPPLGIWKQIIHEEDPNAGSLARKAVLEDPRAASRRDGEGASETAKRQRGVCEREGGERDRQRRARKRDGIGAILEEVINRCESKIDLFCSGLERAGRPGVSAVSAPLRAHAPARRSRSHSREQGAR